jgi:hypothetical protein
MNVFVNIRISFFLCGFVATFATMVVIASAPGRDAPDFPDVAVIDDAYCEAAQRICPKCPGFGVIEGCADSLSGVDNWTIGTCKLYEDTYPEAKCSTTSFDCGASSNCTTGQPVGNCGIETYCRGGGDEPVID